LQTVSRLCRGRRRGPGPPPADFGAEGEAELRGEVAEPQVDRGLGQFGELRHGRPQPAPRRQQHSRGDQQRRPPQDAWDEVQQPPAGQRPGLGVPGADVGDRAPGVFVQQQPQPGPHQAGADEHHGGEDDQPRRPGGELAAGPVGGG
jgi:hypothetical protein